MLIKINIEKQRMQVKNSDQQSFYYDVSTAANGPGEEMDSEQTPRGWHQVRAKIGAGAPVGTVFVGRRPTGEIYTPELGQASVGRDWILTRILWLSGLEIGKNRLGNVDTMRRYIYIHGTPDETNLGVPGSRGCIRMRDRDLIELFDMISVGDRVFIA